MVYCDLYQAYNYQVMTTFFIFSSFTLMSFYFNFYFLPTLFITK